jgi:hypothetical protein
MSSTFSCSRKKYGESRSSPLPEANSLRRKEYTQQDSNLQPLVPKLLPDVSPKSLKAFAVQQLTEIDDLCKPLHSFASFRRETRYFWTMRR